MLSTDLAYLGIHLTSGRKPLTYATVDKDLNLLAISSGDMQDILFYVASLPRIVIAINTPFELRGKSTRGEFRTAELELRERGIMVAGTPSTLALCPASMQLGFKLIRKLSDQGFKYYPEADNDLQMLETNSHACFCALAEDVPLSRTSLEGRLQRQLILYERGLRIKDPMDFFEEITRHKMVKGIWPMELLYSPNQLDALVAAFTAWSVVQKTASTSFVGNKKDGQIFLPVSTLKEEYK
ncbi:MAG: DUF429 domain-containing protein [Anaerolineales bacterium]